MNAATDFLPSPVDLPPIEGVDPRALHETVRRSPKDKEPLSALVFKIAMDEGRKVLFLRIFSGVIESGESVYNVRTEQKERVARLFTVHAAQRRRLDRAGAGSIVAAAGLKSATTGDTLCDEEAPILLERIDTYEPVISVAIESRTQAARKKLDFAMGKMVEEDPTFRVRQDEETGQTLISGMGELHLEVIVDRLVREYGVEAKVGRPQVVYRETIQATADAASTFERKLKEAELYGEASCRIRPLARGSGIRTVSAVSEDDGVPPAIVRAALDGLEEAAQSGPDGFPLEDLEATLLSVKFRDEAQPEIGVKVAAADAFRKAVQQASPLRLEPIMTVEATATEEHLGAVIGDLRSRRGQIQEIGQEGDVRPVSALVPLRLLFGYSTDLRSISKGRANFTMRFHSYDNLAAN
jgi:elongation factor G